MRQPQQAQYDSNAYQGLKNFPTSQLYQTQEINYPGSGSVYMSVPSTDYQNTYVSTPNTQQYRTRANNHPVHIRTQPPVPASQFTTTTPLPVTEYKTEQEFAQPQQYVQPAQKFVQPTQQYVQPSQQYVQPSQQYVQQEYVQPAQKFAQPAHRFGSAVHKYAQPAQQAQQIQQFRTSAPVTAAPELEATPIATEAPTLVVVPSDIPVPAVRAPVRRVKINRHPIQPQPVQPQPQPQPQQQPKLQFKGQDFIDTEELPETQEVTKFEETEQERLLREKQAKNAHYSFGTSIDDKINDHSIQREEVRDGLALHGMYSYSDGFFKRTVHYEADENGYRVVK